VEPAQSGPQLRYKTDVEMKPAARTSRTVPPSTVPRGSAPPDTGPQSLGSIHTFQPGTGPQVAVDDPPNYWADTGPQPALDTGGHPVAADWPGAEPDTGDRGRKRPASRPSADRDAHAAGTDPGRPVGRAARSATSGRSARRPGRRQSRQMMMLAAGLALVVVVAVVAAFSLLGGSGPAHVLVTPDRLGAYVRRPALEKQANAAALKQQVIAKSAGQASHVVSAVYEDSTGSSPQMILFIGGNLSGVSAGSFISSFTAQSKGAFVTSPGSLGGSAACVNAQSSVPGSVALCTWADNDTFGVVASLTMNATRLAAEMRAMRPMVERVAK
jgi:hypothetical protein